MSGGHGFITTGLKNNIHLLTRLYDRDTLRRPVLGLPYVAIKNVSSCLHLEQSDTLRLKAGACGWGGFTPVCCKPFEGLTSLSHQSED
jgi:hypothetical protein